jgi:hypothetical protein
MVLSSEALDILAYLESAGGKFMSAAEISRRAGGKRQFEKHPDWARGLLSRLVDEGLIEVNERGHYHVPAGAQPPAQPQEAIDEPPAPPSCEQKGAIVGEDYFPPSDAPRIVGDDFFPGELGSGEKE